MTSREPRTSATLLSGVSELAKYSVYEDAKRN
jgi:hypothetical protein